MLHLLKCIFTKGSVHFNHTLTIVYFPNQSNPVKSLLNNFCCKLYSCNLQPLEEVMDNGEMFTLNSYMACYSLKNALLNLVTRLETLNDLNHEDVKVTEDYDFGIPEINQ